MNDEFHGMGGSYVVDPRTQTRKLVERTDGQEPQPDTPAAPADEAPAQE